MKKEILEVGDLVKIIDDKWDNEAHYLKYPRFIGIIIKDNVDFVMVKFESDTARCTSGDDDASWKVKIISKAKK